MAITKIWPIKSTPHLALEYITNPDKTRYKTLISGNYVTPETAALEFKMTRTFAGKDEKILAHHLVQSFAKGEVTPEQAHAIGQELAQNIFGDRFEYVISTHVDRRHIHNHVIINSVSYKDFGKYSGSTKTYWAIRKENDRLCKEQNLSIPEGRGKGKKMSTLQHTQAQESGRASWRDKLKENIDDCIINSKDMASFLERMQHLYGYEIKQGAHLAFRAPEQQRFTRAKSIGDEYTNEKIAMRIVAADKHLVKVAPTQYEGNVQSVVQRATKPQTFEQWLMIRAKRRAAYLGHGGQAGEAKRTAAQLLFLKEQGITSSEEFQQALSAKTAQLEQLRQSFTLIQSGFIEKQKLTKSIYACGKYADLFSDYLKSQNRSDFAKLHPEVALYKEAINILKENGITTQLELNKAVEDYNQSKADIAIKKELIEKLQGEVNMYQAIDETVKTERPTKEK